MRPSRSSMFQLAVAASTSVIVAIATFKLQQPIIMAAVGFAPLAAIFAWANPFLICSLFIAIAHFRLHEAYPFLIPFKPAFFLGITAVALLVGKAMTSSRSNANSTRELRAACSVLAVLACVAGYSYSLIVSSSPGALDVVAIPSVMALSMLCAILWYHFLSSTAPAPLPRNITFFLVYFCLLCISVVFAFIPTLSFHQWSASLWKVAAMTLAVAWMGRSEREFSRAATVLIVSGVLVAAVVIYNQWHGLNLVDGTRVTIGGGDDRSNSDIENGILSDPNDLALVLLFPLGFAVARLAHRSSIASTSIAAVSSSLILAGILATSSRGAIIGILAVVGCLTIIKARSWATIIAGAGLIVILFVGLTSFDNRSSLTAPTSDNLDQSSQGRLEAWQAATRMAAANPLTGVGFANFTAMYFTYANPEWTKRNRAAHSMWFEVLGECGIVALFFFVAMIVESFRINARTIMALAKANAPPSFRSIALGLQCALAGTCASGTFLSQAHTFPIFMIIGLIAAVANSESVRNHATSNSVAFPPASKADEPMRQKRVWL